jgi:hypothetical protein
MVLYGCIMRSLATKEEGKLRVYEDKAAQENRWILNLVGLNLRYYRTRSFIFYTGHLVLL